MAETVYRCLVSSHQRTFPLEVLYLSIIHICQASVQQQMPCYAHMIL
jgi:hypothetical protein